MCVQCNVIPDILTGPRQHTICDLCGVEVLQCPICDFYRCDECSISNKLGYVYGQVCH